MGGQTGSALESACEEVGKAFSQDLNNAGDDVDQAITEAVASCNKAVDSLPEGDAQATLSSLCDAINSAGDGS